MGLDKARSICLPPCALKGAGFSRRQSVKIVGVRWVDVSFPLPSTRRPLHSKVKIKESFTGLPDAGTIFVLLFACILYATLYIYFKFNNKYTGIPANDSGSGSGKGRGIAD
jgi:hypothetical protein